MRDRGDDAFSRRLLDLLSTLESSAVIGLAKSRVRGLGEQLAFACAALGAAEGLAALEMSATSNLIVPVVADASSHREVHAELPLEGTLLAHVLSGGGAFAVSIEPGDELAAPLLPLLSGEPRAALLVPTRIGDRTVGGVCLVSYDEPFGDDKIAMAERLSEVVGLTVEAFFTERMMFELFASALPDLLGKDAATGLGERLTAHLRQLRLTPTYRRRLELALSIGRLTSRSDLEGRLATRVLDAFERYVAALEGAPAIGEDDVSSGGA